MRGPAAADWPIRGKGLTAWFSRPRVSRVPVPITRSGRLLGGSSLCFVSFVVIALLLGDALTSDGDVTSNPESKQAEALIHESFPPAPTPSEIVIVRSDRYTVDDPAFEAKVLALSERGAALAVVADASELLRLGR